ncbi:MAG: DUF5913 domain-containing protein, partial [bacterium]|nr:DUF5913 domain-containing protein [bacterium]
PDEATSVDFAYAVHTEVGTRCIGARVDNQIVPLSTALETGSTVEILTSPHQHPHRDWLSFIKTPRARSAIRRWLREEEHNQRVRLGQAMVERELRQRRKKAREDALKTVAEAFQFSAIEDLYAAIGNGDISIGKFYNKLFPKAKPQPPKLQTETRSKNKDALRIHGLNNLMVHYARCCNPIAGDPVVGIVTRGRGLSVHRRDCRNLIHSSEDQERIVELDWDTAPQETFTLDILVTGFDRTNFLADITLAISNMGIPIVGAEVKTKNGEVHDRFQLEVQNADQVATLFQNLAAINGLTSVQRLTDISAKLA